MSATLISMEDALKKVGGFGKQQWLNLFALAVARQSHNLFVYGFAYFIYPQQYFCKDDQGELFKCDLNYVCAEHNQNKFVDYQIDNRFGWFHWNWY
jgi:hypothetical protein